MKKITRKFKNEIENKFSKTLRNVAKKTGESAIDGYCLLAVYEPKIPTELLRK